MMMKSFVSILLLCSSFILKGQGVFININNGEIYEVNADFSLTLTNDVNNNFFIADIAISPDGKMYGVAGDELIEIDRVTGVVTVLTELPHDGYVSLVCDSEFQLYTLPASQMLYRYNILTDSLEFIADVGDSTPGDLTFYSGHLIFQSSTDGHIKAFNLETGILSTILCSYFPFDSIGLWGMSNVFISCDSQTVYATDFQANLLEYDIEEGLIVFRQHYDQFSFQGLDINGMASTTEYLASECNHTFENIECLSAILDGDKPGSPIRLFPNPATEQVSVASKDEVREIRIFSADGTLIKSIHGETNTIDVGDLAHGIYFILIMVGNQLFYKKLIVD